MFAEKSHALSTTASPGATTTTTTTTTKPFAVNLKFSIKDDRRNDFLSLIQANQQKTLDLEDQSLQYVVGEDATETNTFYLHEQFTSLEGFQREAESTDVPTQRFRVFFYRL